MTAPRNLRTRRLARIRATESAGKPATAEIINAVKEAAKTKGEVA